MSQSPSVERLLVTGANGFVGRAVCQLAIERGYQVTAAVRTPTELDLGPKLRVVTIGSIDGTTDWTKALKDVSVVVHVAGRAHVMRERAVDPLREFRRVNAEATQRLAECASRHGIRRVVFVSSIKVNGERTELCSRGFRETDDPSPQDPYGVSKHEGERALAEVAAKAGLETTIVRPPLVFGPGVRANFLSLMRWVDRGLPLPFGAVRNRRSLVSVWNLADLLLVCARHPAAAGQTFLVSEDRDVSTPELVRLVARALDRPARLISLPRQVLSLASAATGTATTIRRLCESLHVDSAHARAQLEWRPALTLEEGISRTARWYRRRYDEDQE